MTSHRVGGGKHDTGVVEWVKVVSRGRKVILVRDENNGGIVRQGKLRLMGEDVADGTGGDGVNNMVSR